MIRFYIFGTLVGCWVSEETRQVHGPCTLMFMGQCRTLDLIVVFPSIMACCSPDSHGRCGCCCCPTSSVNKWLVMQVLFGLGILVFSILTLNQIQGRLFCGAVNMGSWPDDGGNLLGPNRMQCVTTCATQGSDCSGFRPEAVNALWSTISMSVWCPFMAVIALLMIPNGYPGKCVEFLFLILNILSIIQSFIMGIMVMIFAVLYGGGILASTAGLAALLFLYLVILIGATHTFRMFCNTAQKHPYSATPIEDEDEDANQRQHAQ